MLYPRLASVDGRDVLVDDTQMVGYGEHLAREHRILRLHGAITGEFAFHDYLIGMDSPTVNPNHDPIKIIITSPGGDLDATFLLIDTMKTIQSPVITVGRYCASAACLILASGEERYLYRHAKTMLHLATGQMGGDYKDFAIQHKLMMEYQSKIVDILTEAGVKKSRDEILTDIDRDFWLDSEECIAYGLADKILTPETWREWIK